METYTTDTEEYEEELRSALVCEDDAALKSAISVVLQRLKYSIEFAADAEDGLKKLKFNQYGLIILNERFGGAAPETNLTYKFLQAMPMSTRRHIFLVFTGRDFKTGDNMTAFAKSANMVVNEKDLPDLGTVLKKSIADNDTFYKVFRESLLKMGKM